MSLEPYIAGFFDGEGSIGLYASKKSRRYNLRVSINQVITPQSERLFNFLKSEYGGSLSYPKRQKSHHREAVAWSIYGDRAADFLSAIEPHLMLKYAAATATITWQRKYGSSRAHPKNPERSEQRALEAEAIMAQLAPSKGPRKQ